MTRVRIAVLAAATFALVVALGAPAFAHAALVSSEPTPSGTYSESPRAVQLRFNEPVEVTLGGIRVFNGRAARLVTGPPVHPDGNASQVSVSLPSLDDGTYVVTWRVTSADSHPVEGAFTFQVGATATVRNANSLAARLLSSQQSSNAVGVAYAIDRALVFASLALLIGSVVFLTVVFPRGRAIPRARALVWTGWVATVVTTLVGIPLEGVYASGLGLVKVFDPRVWQDVLDTRFGHVAVMRLVLLALAFPLVRVLLRVDEQREPPRWWMVSAPLVGVGLALTPALSGHASAGDHVALAIPADTVHVGAMACWLGGLCVLFAVVLPRREPDELRAVLPRFSAVALGAIVALVVTGAFQAWRQVGSLEALKDTDYGRILLVKLVFFAALVVAAAFSREVVNRRFRSYDDDDEDHDAVAAREPAVVASAVPGVVPPATGTAATSDSGETSCDDGYGFDDEVRRLRRSVFAEVIIATVILGVTALLVNAAPARTVENAPVSLTMRSSELWVDVTFAPGSAGANDIHITALAVGGGLTTVQDMTVELTKIDADLPPFDVPLQNLGPGHYYAPQYDIPYPGQWRITVRARTSDTDEAVLTGTFTLR